MIADVTSNTKLYPVVTELFIWDWKLNISLVFNTQSCYFLTKYVRLNTLYLFFMNVSNFKFMDVSDSQNVRSLANLNCSLI